jgi:hypothetical protein
MRWRPVIRPRQPRCSSKTATGATSPRHLEHQDLRGTRRDHRDARRDAVSGAAEQLEGHRRRGTHRHRQRGRGVDPVRDRRRPRERAAAAARRSCWTLLTTVDELKGYEETQGLSRPKRVPPGANLPSFPGMDLFRGDQHHSSAHPGPDAYRERGAWSSGRTTRPSTSVARGRTVRRDDGAAFVRPHREVRLAAGDRAECALLRRGGSVRDDDREGRPRVRVRAVPDLARFRIPLYEQMRERDKDFYDRLEAAGFDHDWGDVPRAAAQPATPASRRR